MKKAWQPMAVAYKGQVSDVVQHGTARHCRRFGRRHPGCNRYS
jgi:hypothetical protein